MVCCVCVCVCSTDVAEQIDFGYFFRTFCPPDCFVFFLDNQMFLVYMSLGISC